MKTSPILFQNTKFTITEDTIFYPLCALFGPPLILGLSALANPSVSPIWGLSCYLIFLESNKKIYIKRVKAVLTAIWISSIFTFLAVILVKNHLLQILISSLGYVVYKNSHSEKLAPYLVGFINISILTSSPILGVVGKNTIEGIFQIIRLFGEALIGFLISLISLILYNILKKIVLHFCRNGRKKF